MNTQKNHNLEISIKPDPSGAFTGDPTATLAFETNLNLTRDNGSGEWMHFDNGNPIPKIFELREEYRMMEILLGRDQTLWHAYLIDLKFWRWEFAGGSFCPPPFAWQLMSIDVNPDKLLILNQPPFSK